MKVRNFFGSTLRFAIVMVKLSRESVTFESTFENGPLLVGEHVGASGLGRYVQPLPIGLMA